MDISEGKNNISLKDWIQELSPNINNDLILQIDIEGAEYSNLLSASTSTLNRFRIIVIELHELGRHKNNVAFFAENIAPLLEKLNKTHAAIHLHPNNCCGYSMQPETGLNIPNVMEVTYLRRDRFTLDKSSYVEPQLPHPLDITRNSKTKPPIHLNENWLGGKTRSLEPQRKIISDNADFDSWEQIQFKKNPDEYLLNVNFHRLSSYNLYASTKGEVEDKGELSEKYSDLANGKKFILSKPHAPFPARGFVEEDSRLFFHTVIEINQSITIDLEKSNKLNYLVVGNRRDACQDRAKCLFYVIHDTEKWSADDALPMLVLDDFLRPGGADSVTPLFAKQGRFLTIFSPIRTALHFSSIFIC